MLLPIPLLIIASVLNIAVEGTKYARKIRVLPRGLEVRETTDFKRLFVSEHLDDGELIDCWEVTDSDELSKRLPEFDSTNGDVNVDSAVNEQSFLELSTKCKHQSRPASHTPLRRPKRSLSIMPGTNWCGSGHRAPDPHNITNDLDRCCRQHDSCPIFLRSGEFKYGVRNYLPYTLSYCKCDRRFHHCLKVANSSTADLVGRFFFNIIHNECFDLERERACKEWYLFGWGGCKKYGSSLVAKFRELPRY